LFPYAYANIGAEHLGFALRLRSKYPAAVARKAFYKFMEKMEETR